VVPRSTTSTNPEFSSSGPSTADLRRRGTVLDVAPGKPTRIGARPAKLDVRPGSPDSSCAQVGGDESIIATIELAPASSMVMTACLRGPGLAGSEAQVRAMLSSATIQGYGALPAPFPDGPAGTTHISFADAIDGEMQNPTATCGQHIPEKAGGTWP
jgi:hypothetical protein